MELLQYWKIIRKRLLLILFFVLIAVLGALFYVQRQVPLYRSTTTLFISPKSLGQALSYQLVYAVGPLADTYSEYMRTTTFAEMVAEAMDVEISPEEVKNALSAQYINNTQIFRISATHRNPEVAQKLANTTAQILIGANAERQRQEQEARIDAQSTSQTELREEQLRELLAVLEDELAFYDDQITRLDSEIRLLQQGPASAETTQRVLNLRGQMLELRAERVTVLESLVSTQTTLADMVRNPDVGIDTAVVIDPAPLPTRPIGRDVLQPIVAAIMAALALGFGLAWFLEYLDYTIKTPEELDGLYGMPTQGAIGVIDAGPKKDRRSETLVTLTAPRSPSAEAFRSLRTSVRLAALDRPIRRLLITSAGPGEGKTFVSANLAVSFAQEGRKVILVDIDLRRPQVHSTFGLHREPGFTNVAMDPELALADVLQPGPTANLQILTCGLIPPHPSELLGSTRAVELMDLLSEQADLVIYDSPPAATVTDAVVVAQHMDGVLQVVSAGVTRRDLVLRCKTLLERAGAKIIGPVLNRVDASNMGYYYNYYYYGGYYQQETDGKRASGFGRWFGGKGKQTAAAPAESRNRASANGRRATAKTPYALEEGPAEGDGDGPSAAGTGA